MAGCYCSTLPLRGSLQGLLWAGASAAKWAPSKFKVLLTEVGAGDDNDDAGGRSLHRATAGPGTTGARTAVRPLPVLPWPGPVSPRAARHQHAGLRPSCRMQ